MIRDGLRNVTKTLFEIGCYWLVIIGGVICGLYTAIVGEKRYTPRPVSTVGRRRLSASFKPGALGLIDQSKFSYLFSKLSPELRLMIYREVLGDHLIHIGLCPGKNRRDNARMAHVRCPFVKNYSCDQWKYRGCNLRRIPKYSDNNRVIDLSYRPSASHYGTTKGLLSLLKTCRQIYTEAIDILYSCNVFDCGPEETTYLFLNSILPRQRDAIRTLQFYHQPCHRPPTRDHVKCKAWLLVSRMKGLRGLHVLTLCHIRWTREVPLTEYVKFLTDNLKDFIIYTQRRNTERYL